MEVRSDIVIDADPMLVYAIVSNVERTGEWSPECVSCHWLDAATQPVVGARYRGVSRNGWRRWSTTATITAGVPGSELSWHVTYLRRPVADWQYRLTALSDEQTMLEESVVDRREPWLKVVSPWITGSRDRAARNSATIDSSLARIKSIAETEAARSASS